jgi:hypothetical protein
VNPNAARWSDQEKQGPLDPISLLNPLLLMPDLDARRRQDADQPRLLAEIERQHRQCQQEAESAAKRQEQEMGNQSRDSERGYPASITVTLTAASEMVAGGRTARPRTMSDALSAIMMTGALMLPPTRSGITEASTTRKASVPNTFSLVSTTAVGSLAMPILQVPSG